MKMYRNVLPLVEFCTRYARLPSSYLKSEIQSVWKFIGEEKRTEKGGKGRSKRGQRSVAHTRQKHKPCIA